MSHKKPLATLLLFAAALAARAALVGPYAPDANTLHLWHLDETTTPVVDSAAVGINLSGLLTGATLGNASYPLLTFENVRAGRSGQATI